MKLRGTIFGSGMISEFHLRAWLRIPEVEIVAIGNRTLSRASERRDQFVPGARIYSDLAAMLESERPDFVDILTPPAQHLAHCGTATEFGVHIICQKPLAGDLESARAISRTSHNYRKIFAVHENHRYRPWFRPILQDLKTGVYGHIHFARFEHLNGGGPLLGFKTESEKGVLLEYGTHVIDMMRAVLGEPRRVYTRLHCANPLVRGESLAHAVFEYTDSSADISVAWKHSGMTQGSVLICGVRREAWYEGTLTRGESSRLRIIEGSAAIRDEARSPYDDYVESFYLLQREVTDAMLGRGTVLQTPAEQLQTLACTLAAYESARRREPVEIAEFAAGAS